MVVIFGKQLNHSSPIEVLTKMMIYLYLMMGKLLTTPMIYAEYSIIILRILLVDDTIYQDDTCESCISDHDNHRSIGQIRNLMKLAHTGETQFSFKTVDVAVIKKHLKNCIGLV